MTLPKNINIISSVEALQALNGNPKETTLRKILPSLEQHSRHFIDNSPFALLATCSKSGTDASPRGDSPGFVQCIDDTTLLIPERPGNRIADSMRNIIEDGRIGLLFLIPGINETLRVNGNAYITDDQAYREKLVYRGKVPKLAIVVDVKEVYFHCAKAFIRSELWHPDSQVEPNDFPSLGKILIEQITKQKADAAAVAGLDANLTEDAKENLY
ncbi:MAG: PPOX class probable FMN-dependent enzyme [Oceanicoccus sp.]|jgi:PPOX class probable FMN-dependent enzyme